MAFFKFRKGADEPAAPASAPESVEAMRTRAKHRLIGAAVLVLAGVIGFPLLFDNQPRPIAVDIPIEIPDKAKAKPLTIAPQLAAVASASASGKVVGPASTSGGVIDSTPVSKPQTPPSSDVARVAGGSVTSAPAPAPAPVASVPVAVAPRPSAPASLAPSTPSKPAAPESKPVAATSDAAKALALLEGKEVSVASKPAAGPAAASSAAPSGARFIVQVGAYAEVLKAREARQKLEQAGLKTYTQVVNSAEGKRIRVRIGPFENKMEAEKAAEKVRKLDLPAAILEL